MSKHTKGPWAAKGAEVFGEGRRVADCDRHAPYVLEPEDEANARLIAASPDLLAACELWDKGFTDGEQFTEQQFLKWVNDNRQAARAAIAKAKGTN